MTRVLLSFLAALLIGGPALAQSTGVGGGGGSTSPGGSNGDVQCNSSGAFGACTPTGTGSVVRATSPTLVTPTLGTPASGVATNLTGTAAGLTAGNVTTNANLTGPITSSGNATSIASQTGTGTKFVVDTSPTLVTPVLGAATATTPAAGDASTKVATTAFLAAPGPIGNTTPNTGAFTTLSGNIAVPVNAQSGTTYAMSSTDQGKLVTFSNASAIAVSLAQAGTGGFTTGWSTTLQNLGAGQVTITPATSTINGAATLVLAQNSGVILVSDGTNYQVFTGNPTSSGCQPCTGAQTISVNAAVSTPALKMSGTISAGGTGTTNFPLVLIQPATATASTSWSTSGTALGINAHTGAVGNLIDFQVDGTSELNLSPSGIMIVPIVVASTSVTGSGNGWRLFGASSAGDIRGGTGTMIGWSSAANANNASADTGFYRDSAGVVDVGNGTASNKTGKLIAAQLATGGVIYSAAGTAAPTCNGAAEGDIISVSDASSIAFNHTYVSGGSTHEHLGCDGTNWKDLGG